MEVASITQLFGALVKWRRFTAVVVVGGSLAFFILAFTLPKRYTANATILPSGGSGGYRNLGRALDLSDLGLDLGMNISPNSSFLFPTILRSRHVRDKLLSSRFGEEGSKELLSDILGTRGEEQSRRALDRIIRIDTDRKTGIIWIRATTGDPGLSAMIVNRMLSLLKEFGGEKRRTKAWLNYRFLRDEFESTKLALFEMEEELAAFERNHRDYATTTDPKVIMEHERLLHNLTLEHEIFIDLNKQLELADINLKREEPLVKVLDEASVPQIKSAPPRKIIFILGSTLSLLVGLVFPLVREVSVGDIIRRFLNDSP